jgi:hypothetical protein
MKRKENSMSKRVSKSLLAVAVCLAGVATAQTVPQTVAFTARLADNGVVVQGSKQFIFKLYPTISGGTEVWSENQTLTVVDGDVNAQLGASMQLSETIFGGGALYLEVTIEGTVLSPRTAVVSVPYSIRAGVAGKVGTFAETDIQKRVTATCPVGSSIRVIDSSGAVTCQSASVTTGSDGGVSISGVFGGTGLTGGGNSGDVTLAVSFGTSGSANTVARSDHTHTGVYLPIGTNTACTSTDKVTAIGSNGNVTCSPDLGVTYTAVANGGVVVGATTVGLISCATGEILKATGSGTWSCQADATGGGSVTASAPLTSSGGANPNISLTGVVGLANGGTGGTTSATARAGIQAAASGANSDITSLSGLTAPLGTSVGGTGLATSGAAGNFLRSGGGSGWASAPISSSDLPSLTATYVDLVSAQSIGGAKTFTSAITANLIGNVTGSVSGTSAGFTGSLGGDVGGTMSGTVVSGLRGRPVSNNAPADNQALVYRTATSQWLPQTIVETDGVIGNEVTGATNGSLTVSGAGTTASPLTLGIATSGVGTNELAPNSVTTAKIASGVTVTGTFAAGYAQVTSSATMMTQWPGSCPSGSGTCYYGTTTASCAAGLNVIGGGCNINNALFCYLVDSFPTGNSWQCHGVCWGQNTDQLAATAICARIQ